MPEQPNSKIRTVPPPPIAQAATSPHAYAELDVATNFSFLRGASHPDELVHRAALLGYRAIAVTDINSLAGVVRAHEAAKELGMKLVIGTKLLLNDAPPLLVWPTDRAAYGRLCRLLTLGKRRAEKGQCHLAVHDFLDHSDGMIAALVPAENDAGIERQLHDLRAALGNRISLAVSRPYGSHDAVRVGRLLRLSRSTGVPPLATNHVQYHDPQRRALHDVLTCIREGCTIMEAGYRLSPNAERYMKSPEQMHRLFADYPQAIRRGVEIAEQCAFSLEQLRYEYPVELVPPGTSPIRHLADLTHAGAAGRYPHGVPERVRELIDRELSLIEQLRYEPYFLTVHDLVRFARSKGILCQGRGSAANSAVCYCLGVTSVDPARIDVLFERFVSASRNEPPDIDIDFEHERREEVIQYVYEKYRRERAGMTATVITYRGRSAVRDVGKAMGLGLDVVDQMAKQLDWWDSGTLMADRIREVGLDPSDRTVRQVIALSGQLLGFPRHLSQHTGGMVMTRAPLCEMVPIENASMPDRTVIEWDKDDIDTLGILKVDVLALGMLTAIAKCLKLVNDQREAQCPPLELATVPPEDPAVYDMVSDADTVGVFQIESRAQMSMLPRLRPNKFYDLVIEVAIVRPGPIQGDMVHPYLRRRNGEEPVTYPSEALRRVLQKTLGVPLFQEQAMQLVMVGAGFSGAEADKLRRAMAAWRRSGAIDTFQQKIIDGMVANGYSVHFAIQTFNQIKGFGEYGFPESHSASFALLVYVSAWLKRHHPAAFCCALLNSQPMGFYAPAQLVRDAKEHGVEVRPVDVNHSEWDCTLEKDLIRTAADGVEGKTTWGRDGPALRLGFRMIKGMRGAHAARVVERRRQYGPFTSIDQFHDVTGLPVSAVEQLSESDAFSSLPRSRRAALWQTTALCDEHAPLFAGLHASHHEPVVALPAMPLEGEVMTDYAMLGLSLKRHPIALIRPSLEAMKVITAHELVTAPHGKWVHVAGLVLIRQRPGTASGIVFETLEDETGVVNLIIRPKVFDRYRSAARHASLVRADGSVERQGQVVHVMVYRMFDLSTMISGYDTRSRDFH